MCSLIIAMEKSILLISITRLTADREPTSNIAREAITRLQERLSLPWPDGFTAETVTVKEVKSEIKLMEWLESQKEGEES